MQPTNREQHRFGVTYNFLHPSSIDDVRIEGVFPRMSSDSSEPATHCESEIQQWYLIIPYKDHFGPCETYNECLHILEEYV